MRHLKQILIPVGLLLFALSGWGETQQPRAARNANSAQRVPSQGIAAQAGPASVETSEPPATVALLGAVKKPGIYQASTPSVTLEALIEAAGGLTPENNGGVRFYRNGQSQVISPIDRMLTIPLMNGQVVFVTPRGGMTRSSQPAGQVPFRPVVITGIGETPLILNLGGKSLDVEGLVNLLGQSPEVLGSDQFMATCPQRQWLSPSDMLCPNSIVHFPAETVNHERVRWAMQNGLVFEPPFAMNRSTRLPDAAPVPAVSPSDSAAPADRPPVDRPAVPPRQPPATGLTIPGFLPTQNESTEIEPVRSEVHSPEPLRLRQYRDEEEREEPRDAEPHSSTGPSKTGRPPIMMPPEWSTFGEDADDVDSDRKIERTSARLDSSMDEGFVLTSSAVAAPGEPEPLRLLETDSSRIPAHRGIDPWVTIGVMLGIAGISFLITRLVSRDDQRVVDLVDRRSSPVVPTSSEIQSASLEPGSVEAAEDRRFLQRLIVNQLGLVEEEPTLPPVDHLHGVVIGNRRMMVHDTHEGVVGPHFAVREKNDTRPMERRLRTVLREAAAKQVIAKPVVESAAVRPAVSPLERALRNVDQGGRG